MKKFLFILAAVTIGFGTMAQGNGKGKGHNKQGKARTNKGQNREYENNQYGKKDRTVQDQVFGRSSSNGSNTGKYTNKTPRKVSDAFYQDYPNASNVSWTKDRGVWTASFNNRGIFRSANTASYHANGQRVGSNNDNTVMGRSRERNTTQQSSGVSVWDKISRRN